MDAKLIPIAWLVWANGLEAHRRGWGCRDEVVGARKGWVRLCNVNV
jgi:hypothetical protein